MTAFERAMAAAQFFAAPVRLKPATRYGVAVAIVVGAFLLRLAILPIDAGLGFLTFYPAMALVAMLLGVGPAILVAGLGGFAGYYWFMAPYGELKFDYQPLVSLVAFAIAAAILCVIAGKKARALEQRESLLASIVRCSSDAIASKTLDGRITSWNPAAERLFGYRAEEAIGMRMTALFPPDRLDEESELLTCIAAGDSIVDRESVRVAKDGRAIDVSVSLFPIIDRQGRVIGSSNIIRDITERKSIQETMRSSKSNLQAALEAMSDAVYISDKAGDLIEMNSAFVKFYKFSTRDECFKSIRQYPEMFEVLSLSGDIVPVEQWVTARALRGEIVNNAEFVLHRRDSGEKWIGSYNFAPIRDETGTILGAVVTARDITEVKRAEEQLRIDAVAFEAQEGILITDADSVILRVNQAFCEITGYKADEVIGKKTTILRSDRHSGAFYQKILETLARKGVWKGEVWRRRKNGEVYPEWQTASTVIGPNGTLSHYVVMSTDITERKSAEAEIERLAFYDTLTRLPNRRLVLDRLKQALAASARSGRIGALLFIDLDHFKGLNDTHGHDIGDKLLQEVAQRLTAAVRQDDTVARLGGDEFVVILADLDDDPDEAAAQTKAIGGKILRAISQPAQLGEGHHHSTASIGATLFLDHRQPIDELLKRADMAMYQAKANGRNTLCFFDPDMQAAIARRGETEDGLRRGIHENQFILHYQRQVDHAGRTTGAEALVRWLDPVHGLVQPAAFIALAEKSGLILPLGQWILETACRQILVWSRQPATALLTVAVNVSAREFAQVDFVDQVLGVVNRTGVDPSKLKLELTETMLFEQIDGVIAKMTALNQRGLSFALDDFGTGYSSLSSLKRLPLSQLKIDKSFVQDVLTDPNDAAIARTIIALANSLGLGVIAEGVETELQRAFLAEQGCRAYQGYLYGRPVPAAEFQEMIAADPDKSDRRATARRGAQAGTGGERRATNSIE